MTLIDSQDANNFFNLDTIGFGRLVEDARSRIPRYAPEWTDHNLHDPGMTIIDLLAWVVDQQIYRLGFISDRHLSAFAALLGERPSGPMAASGVVWSDGTPTEELLLAAGSRIAPLSQADIGFVIGREVLLSVATLDGLALVDSDGRRPLSLRRGGPLTPLALAEDTVMVLSFDRPLATISGPISIGFETAGMGEASPASGAADQGAIWGPLVFEYRIGDGDWVPVDVLFDGTAALSRSGVVKLEIPPSNTAEPSELRLRFDQGFFPLTPSLRQVALNTLTVVQHDVEPARKLADGNGQPDQMVAFDRTGLVEAPTILVDDEEWLPQEDFCDSGPDDPHYVLQTNGAAFGNGVNGRRPAVGEEIRLGPVVRTAGAAGNLRAEVAWELRPPSSSSNAVVVVGAGEGGGETEEPEPYLGYLGRSCEAFTGGAPASTVEDLLAAARARATERQNLLTDEDLAQAALDLADFQVARADVLSGYDPVLPGRFASGTRSLVVFPQRSSSEESTAVPAGYLEAVGEALEPQRLLGERLLVLAPELAVVDVDISLAINPGELSDLVAADVIAAIERRLSVLSRTGADGQSDPPWPLGRPVTVAEIKALAARVPGVMFVSRCLIGQSGQLGDDPVTLPQHGVAVSGSVEVLATPAAPGQGGKRQ